MKNSLRLVLILAIVTAGLYGNNGVMAQGSNLSISIDGEIFNIEDDEFIKSEGHYYVEVEKLALIFDMYLEVTHPRYCFVKGDKIDNSEYQSFSVIYKILIEPDDAYIDYDPIGLNFIDTTSVQYGLGAEREYPTQVGKIRDGKTYVSVRFLADNAFYNVSYDVEHNTVMLESKEKHWAEPYQNHLIQFLGYEEANAYFNLYDMDRDGYPEVFVQWSGKMFYTHFNPYTGYVEYPIEYPRDETYLDSYGYYLTAIQEEFDLSDIYGNVGDESWNSADLDVWKYTIIREKYEEGYNKIREDLDDNIILIPLVPLTEENIELVSKMKP